MKRVLLTVLLVVCISVHVTTVFTSCAIPYERPYGIWQNETVGLTLFIDPHNYGNNSGIYVIGNEEHEVVITFRHDKGFIVQDVRDFEGARITNNYRYFDGRFRVRDDKLYYTLTRNWQEQTGIRDTIVFEKVADYEVPD